MTSVWVLGCILRVHSLASHCALKLAHVLFIECMVAVVSSPAVLEKDETMVAAARPFSDSSSSEYEIKARRAAAQRNKDTLDGRALEALSDDMDALFHDGVCVLQLKLLL